MRALTGLLKSLVVVLVMVPSVARSQTLPLCDDVVYSASEVDAAMDAAQAALAQQSITITDVNDPNAPLLFAAIADQLGCRLPDDGSISGLPTTMPDDCSQYNSYESGVNYCGPGDSRTSNLVIPVGDNILNGACWIHDACYCNRCIVRGCSFSREGDAAPCDNAFLGTCTASWSSLNSRERFVCRMAARLVWIPRPRDCSANATACTGDCHDSVCVRGRCIGVTDQNDSPTLDLSKPLSAKVTSENPYCANFCGACGGCPDPHGCIAFDQVNVNYYLCSGATGSGLSCYGQSDFVFTCSASCGDAPCSEAPRIDAWQKIANCASTNNLPLMQGPQSINSVMWFGSQPQLQACLGCVAP